jgi:hypothetical protein
MALTHKCPAPKCPVQVPNSMLACRPHWYGLSRELRNDVWATVDLPITNPTRASVLADVITYYAGRGW